jgi:hypothetical protein
MSRVLSASFLLLLAACSNSSSGGGAGPSDGGDGSADRTFAQGAAEVAAAYCDHAQACAPAFLTLAYGDIATCNARFVAAVTPTLGANGTTYTPDQLHACAQAVPGTSCGDFLAHKPATACRPPAGTLADGAACAADAQCAGTRCKIPFGQVCGTCAKHAAAGAPCGVDDDCSYGLKCVGGSCVAYGNENDTCDGAHPCRPDLGCKAGKCGTPSTSGTACTDSAECDGAHGLFCGTVSKQCAPVTFDSAGQACGLVQQHIALCAGPGGYCAGLSSSKVQGTCRAAAADGASCDAVNGPLCNGGAVCVCAGSDAGCPGTCKLPDPSACK